MLYIEPNECIDCDACAIECPVNAIFAERDVPEEWQHYIALNDEMSKRCPTITQRKEPLAGR
jgi:ferredoxin